MNKDERIKELESILVRVQAWSNGQTDELLDDILSEVFEKDGSIRGHILLPTTCDNCKGTDVVIKLECHNSHCTCYAEGVHLYQGWNK